MERTRKLNVWTSIVCLAISAGLLAVQPAAGQTVIPNCEIRVVDRGRISNDTHSDANLSASSPDGELKLGRHVEFADGTSVSGALIGLGNAASVFDVNVEVLKLGRGAIVRGTRGVFTGGGPACELPEITCGGPDVLVKKGDAPRSISPGSYGTVDVQNGTSLSLAPGVYNFCSIKGGRHVTITVTGATQSTINVAGDVRFSNDLSFQPASGTPTPLLNVGGDEVHFGATSAIRAFITAPDARLRLGRSSTLTGAACVQSIVTGWHASLECAPDVTTPTTTTSTTVATSTTFTPTTTTSSTSTTAPAETQCCVPGSAGGAFTCTVETPAQCETDGGTAVGPGTCSPDPCGSTTTVAPTTTTSSTAGPTTTTSSTTTTTAPAETQCCVPGSAEGAFTCIVETPAQCETDGGTAVGPGTCSPDPCGSTTTVAPTTTTSSTAAPTTTTSSTAAPTTTTSSTAAPTTTTSSTAAPITTTSSTAAPTTTTSSTAVPTTTTSSTSTSTSSTTSTTVGPVFTKLAFTTTIGTTTCGGGGLVSPAPAAPFSGQLDSDAACTAKIADLGLGCLMIGGGNNTAVPPSRIPDAATNIFDIVGGNPNLVASNGTSPDNCTKGAGPNRHCIATVNNGGACTMDSQCGGGAGSCALDANCFFGPPLPIPNPAFGGVLTTCVINVIQTDGSGTANLTSGDTTVSLPLSSRVYLTANLASPCPKCVASKCNAGPNLNGSCTGVGALATTRECPPAPTQFQAPLPVTLNPLTTGPTSKSADASGNFCVNQQHAGAFGMPTARCIKETGSAGGNLTDGQPHASVLASVFCIPPTNNAAVDTVGDLPGPGAIGLAGNAQLLP